MSKPSLAARVARALPERANLEHLKNEAKQRFAAMRVSAPAAKLADAQFELAREYGFSSWRELKATVDLTAGVPAPNAVGDWIGALTPNVRIALHVRTAEGGGLRATFDSPDYGGFDIPVDAFSADDEALSFALLKPAVNAIYDARWSAANETWSGVWRQNGIPMPLALVRGAFPPAPAVNGLDGIWDGRLEAAGGARLVLHVRTMPQGTFALLDSLDRGGARFPVTSLQRDGNAVAISMKTVAIAGDLSEDGGRIEGRFNKEDRTYPLTLRRRPPGAPPPRGPHPPAVQLTPEIMARYAGDYEGEGAVTAEIAFEADVLTLQFQHQPRFEILPSSSTEFFWRDLDLSATFEIAPEEPATAFTLHRNGRDSRFKRA